jgi:hypothetical protein
MAVEEDEEYSMIPVSHSGIEPNTKMVHPSNDEATTRTELAPVQVESGSIEMSSPNRFLDESCSAIR